MQNFHGDTVMRWWTKSSSGVAKRGVSGLKLRHWFREKEIFHVVMLQFPFVTKITMLNISKYININPKTPSHHKLLATPLKLLLYINDLPNTSSLLHFILFADDSNVFLTHGSYKSLYSELNKELGKVSDWFRANKLSLNLSKTNYILFRSNRKPVPQETCKLVIDNTEIPQVNSVKFLGLYVDQHLPWRIHLENVASKISKNIGIISRIAYLIPTNVRLTLYYSLIYPYIAYCNIIWASNYKSRLYRLKILQKRSVRIIAGLPYNSHTDPIFKHFEILKLFQINLKQINEFMHRYSYSTLPTVFSNFFTPPAAHSYNTRNSSTIKHAFARTNSRKFSIRVAGPITWDELPRDIRSIPTLSLFKTKLNSWLIKCTQ